MTAPSENKRLIDALQNQLSRSHVSVRGHLINAGSEAASNHCRHSPHGPPQLAAAHNYPGLRGSASALVCSMLVRRRAPDAFVPRIRPLTSISFSTSTARAANSVVRSRTWEIFSRFISELVTGGQRA